MVENKPTFFLPKDEVRCLNESCDKKEKCARSLDRLPFTVYWYGSFDEKNCKDFLEKEL